MIEDRRNERRAYADALKKKFYNVEVGKKSVDLDLLDVQRRLALALTKEYQAIAEYNNSLARMEFARGTIMQHDNVVIAENGLPACAQVLAVEHEKERTKALVLLERPNPHTKPDPIKLPGMVAADPNLPVHLDPSTAPPPAADGKETPAAENKDTPAPFPTLETPATPDTKLDADASPLPPLSPEPIEPAFKAKSTPAAAPMPPVTVPAVDLPVTGPALGQEAPALPKAAQPTVLPPALPLVPPTITPAPKATPSLPPPLPEVSSNRVRAANHGYAAAGRCATGHP